MARKASGAGRLLASVERPVALYRLDNQTIYLSISSTNAKARPNLDGLFIY